MIRPFLRVALAALIFAALPVATPTVAGAEEIPADLIRAEVIGGWPTDKGYMGALRLTLAPGWKTYWRSPGEAGIPPTFAWQGSTPMRVRYHWPTPSIFELNGTQTYGYHDELVLPIEFMTGGPVAPAPLTAEIDLGICKDICVPASLKIAADFSKAPAEPAAIRAALAHVPADGSRAGIGPARCKVEPIRDGMRLSAKIPVPASLAADFAIIETDDPAIWIAPVRTDAEPGFLVQTVDMVPPNAAPFALDRSGVRMTVFAEGGKAYDLTGCQG